MADNLLSSAKVSASDERGGQFKVRAVTDGKYDTYWATNDGVTTADLTFTFRAADEDESGNDSGVYTFGTKG